ncbi:MAG TPA: carboxypeptidase-like regulatory domain-containing protein, partial [Thermoanaerobaculia bacterium]
MRRHILFVIAAIFLVARTAIAAGTLCLAANGQEPVCTSETELATVSLEPAPVERRAVWIESDYGTTVVFNVAPHQRQVAVAGEGEIPYRIRSERLSHGVRTIELSLVDQHGQSWKWSVPGRAASGRVLAPAGVYTLNVSVSGARSESVSQIRVDQAGKPNVATIDLIPKAVATGVVVDEAGDPIAGATISGPGDVVLGASGLDGRFVVDDGSARLPEHLTVHAERYASRTIPITDRHAVFEAGTIQLIRGTTVTLRARLAEEDQQGLRDAKASLHRLERQRPLVSRQPLSADSSVTFTHVPPGKYVMLIEGSGPLERYGEIVEVKTDPLLREVVISPAELTGHVYFGVEALAGATVTLAPKRQEWTVNLTTGEDGQFGGVVWQSGLFSAIVEGGALPSPYIDDKDLALSGTWDIIVPDRRISGAIVDERSEKGVAGARITYESSGARMRLSSVASADATGRYEIVGVPEGTIRIRATAPGYLPSEPLDVQIEPTQRSRELRIALSAGSVVKVEVRNEQGAPLSGALVFDDFAGQLNPTRYVTDARGE